MSLGEPFSKEEVEFTKRNNSDVVCILTDRICRFYEEMNSAHVFVKDPEDSKPVAFMISVPIPIKVRGDISIKQDGNLGELSKSLPLDYHLFQDGREQYHISGYSCNLLVDESRRKLGWASHPIKRMIDHGSTIGVHSGYHVTAHRLTPHSFPVKVYYRVLDNKKGKQFGYHIYPANVTTPAARKLWTRNYTFSKKCIRVTEENCAQYYHHYQTLNRGFAISHAPSEDNWKTFVKNTYIYSVEGGGLVGFHIYTISQHTQSIDVAVILFASDPEYCKLAFIEATKQGAVTCYVYSIGVLAGASKLAGLRLIEAAETSWFNTYGMHGPGMAKLTAADVQVPLI